MCAEWSTKRPTVPSPRARATAESLGRADRVMGMPCRTSVAQQIDRPLGSRTYVDFLLFGFAFQQPGEQVLDL